MEHLLIFFIGVVFGSAWTYILLRLYYKKNYKCPYADLIESGKLKSANLQTDEGEEEGDDIHPTNPPIRP